ncbi:uncharacterized protein LOC116741530 [Phocoena sinus]|uniref:uncharacterized protein LOC116741530 n=1 Tax=Phocoena sinus TaxID=42100 RepID=UPI0013C48DCF|nr:uncharacterized protein LOC116741530 [Phocoena sinus]
MLLISFLSALFRVGSGGFSGALIVAAGACVRLVRAQPGERASPAPAEKSALPGAGAGTAAPGGVLLSTSQLEPWLRQRRRRRAPGPGRPGSPRSSRIVCRQLFVRGSLRPPPRDAGTQRRAPRRLDRPGRSRRGIRTRWCWASGPRGGLHSGPRTSAGHLCRCRLRHARLAGAGADGARLTVVQQEQMFVELLHGGDKGLFSTDCCRSWNGIVYGPGKPGKRLVLLTTY